MAQGDDNNGICARKMIRGACRTMPAVAAIPQLGLCTAVCAKPVALVPVEQGARLRQNSKLSLWQYIRYGKAAQIREVLSRRRGTGEPAMATFIDAQKNHFG